MLHLLAYITAKPTMRDAVLKELRGNIAAVRAEEGCIEYRPVVDAPTFGRIHTELGPDTFVVIEQWESATALKAHMNSPHMKVYVERTKDMIVSRLIHVLSPV